MSFNNHNILADCKLSYTRTLFQHATVYLQEWKNYLHRILSLTEQKLLLAAISTIFNKILVKGQETSRIICNQSKFNPNLN